MLSLDQILDLYLEKKEFKLKDKKLYNHLGNLIVDGEKFRNFTPYTITTRQIGM